LPTLVEFVIALGLVVIVASLFTDSVEILGARLEMAQEAVGNVLAAVGTALPETMIPIVAVLAVVFAGR
jgi:cation:H+ antiporter